MKTFVFFFVFAVSIAVATAAIWGNHGANLQNTRYMEDKKINPGQLKQMTEVCHLKGGYSFSATPAIVDDIAYTVGWDSYVYAYHIRTCSVIWKSPVSCYTNRPGDLARATPTVDGDNLIIGTRIIGVPDSAKIFSIKRSNGDLNWITTVHEHFASMITSSGTVYDGYFYVGVSSFEELFASNPLYDCCSFDGRILKLRTSDGQIMWQRSMLEGQDLGPGQWSGNGVWGSSPSIAPEHNLVYFATGNLYDVPDSVDTCLENARANNTSTLDCLIPYTDCSNGGTFQNTTTGAASDCAAGIYQNTVIALDLDTGETVWSQIVDGVDAWTVACLFGDPTNCPDVPGPDYDFGAAPMYLQASNESDDDSGALVDMVVVGQKSGFVVAFDAVDGTLLWSTAAGPGGELGGHMWGGATNGKVAVFGIANSNSEDFQLLDNSTVNTGGWVGIKIRDGSILWTVPVPQDIPDTNISQNFAIGPVTMVNNLAVVASGDVYGSIFGINVDSGVVVWETRPSEEVTCLTNSCDLNEGNPIYGGFAADGDGCILIGIGYLPAFGFGTDDRVITYCVDKKIKTFEDF
jgi:outer membrane protein assembly factor BamB